MQNPIHILDQDLLKELSALLGLSLRHMKGDPHREIYKYCKKNKKIYKKFRSLSYKFFANAYDKYLPNDLPDEVFFESPWINSNTLYKKLLDLMLSKAEDFSRLYQMFFLVKYSQAIDQSAFEKNSEDRFILSFKAPLYFECPIKFYTCMILFKTSYGIEALIVGQCIEKKGTIVDEENYLEYVFEQLTNETGIGFTASEREELGKYWTRSNKYSIWEFKERIIVLQDILKSIFKTCNIQKVIMSDNQPTQSINYRKLSNVFHFFSSILSQEILLKWSKHLTSHPFPLKFIMLFDFTHCLNQPGYVFLYSENGEYEFFWAYNKQSPTLTEPDPSMLG